MSCDHAAAGAISFMQGDRVFCVAVTIPVCPAIVLAATTIVAAQQRHHPQPLHLIPNTARRPRLFACALVWSFLPVPARLIALSHTHILRAFTSAAIGITTGLLHVLDQLALCLTSWPAGDRTDSPKQPDLRHHLGRQDIALVTLGLRF